MQFTIGANGLAMLILNYDAIRVSPYLLINNPATQFQTQVPVNDKNYADASGNRLYTTIAYNTGLTY